MVIYSFFILISFSILLYFILQYQPDNSEWYRGYKESMAKHKNKQLLNTYKSPRTKYEKGWNAAVEDIIIMLEFTSKS